jgi:hypothetical protein
MALTPPVLEEATISDPNVYHVWEVDLLGGVDYTIAVHGAEHGRTLPDPYVDVLDSAGDLVAEYDNTPEGNLDPVGTFTAPTSGAYTIGVYDANGGAGDYTLLLDPVPAQAGSDFFFA